MPTDPTPRRSDDELLALVHQRADAMRHQRSLRALGAAVVVVFVIAGGVAFAGGPDGASRRTIRATDEGATTTSVETTTTSLPEPEIIPVPAAPGSTTTTTTKTRSTSTSTTTTQPAAPLTLTMTASPQPTAAGGFVTFRIRIQDGRGMWTSQRMEFGDGSSSPGQGRMPGCLAPEPGKPEPPALPTDETVEYRHAYRHPGSYVARVLVDTASPCSKEPAPESASTTTTVTIVAGDESSNGPGAPVAYIFGSSQGSNSNVGVQLSGADEDGYVSRMDVDWGDGSADTVFNYPLSACDDSQARTYPRTNWMQEFPTHTYAAAGQYTASLTVTSVGCDSKDSQIATAATQVTYPSSPPS